MAEQDVLEAIGKLDTRLTRVEQFLPQLATREEMHVAIKSAIDEAVAPLATREEMHAAIKSAIDEAVAPLATREEMHVAIDKAVAPLPTRDEMHVAIKEEGKRSRHFTQVLYEDLKDDIRMLSEHVVALSVRVDARR